MPLREWYTNREVLLTGVTSELGRLLLEKILRSFPGTKVYVVVRSRNRLDKEDRIKKIFASPGYERLRQADPNAIRRVTVCEGNLLYDDLGLSKEDREKIEKVSVAFHAAGPPDAVFDFCQELASLEALAAAISVFKQRGQIKEEIQNERIPDLPVALVRIPLIAPALREPMPGYLELLRGSTAFMIGAGYASGTSDSLAQITPVDIAVNTLVAAAWEKANNTKVRWPTVYNAAVIGCTWGDLIAKGHRASRNFPYPTFGMRGMSSCASLHWILVLLFEWLPSILCDTIIGLFNGKQRMLPEYERIRQALRSLESISSKSWSIERNRVRSLQASLPPEDQEALPLYAEIDVESYILCAAAAARKYCVDEHAIAIMKTFRRMFLALAVAAVLYYFVYVK